MLVGGIGKNLSAPSSWKWKFPVCPLFKAFQGPLVKECKEVSRNLELQMVREFRPRELRSAIGTENWQVVYSSRDLSLIHI